MSKNRKIFNLFKFVDEIYYIMRISEDKSRAAQVRFFEIMAHCGAFVHFVMDNIVWMINTRIISSLDLPLRQRITSQRQRQLKIRPLRIEHVPYYFPPDLHSPGMARFQ